MHYNQPIFPRWKYAHPHRPLVKLYARVTLRKQHRAAEVRPRIQGFVDTVHQPSAESIRLVFGDDEDVGEVGKAGFIGDETAEADLGEGAMA